MTSSSKRSRTLSSSSQHYLAGVTPGLTGTADLVVGPEHTAPFVGSGRIAVLATPVMINVIEAAALAAVEHLIKVSASTSM